MSHFPPRQIIKTGSQRDLTLADNGVFFFIVGLYIIFSVQDQCKYHFMYVCACACVVRVCMPGDITLSTAEMGFLESVFEVH